MRLASIIPSIPERILSAFAESGIKTDSDLLFTSGTAADIFLKLPPECPITLREVQETIESVITSTSAPIFRGDRYLELDSERRDNLCRNELNSGVPLLDELVNGFGNYHVLEISGDKGSSKTVRKPTLQTSEG